MARDDKRELLLQATLELVATHGFHGAPCAAIAEQAGVAAGTIYRYFESKDVLIVELYAELEGRITTALMSGYKANQPIRDRFLHLAIGILKYFITHSLEFKYIEQFHNSPYGTAHRRDNLLGNTESSDAVRKCDIYKQLFTEGLELQVIKNLPMPLLFDLAFGPIVSVARNHILGFIRLDDALIEQIAEACWDSLKR
ncbi:TetR/AcrR family transcriptional regulator [Trichlorobacter lovleyi]|uniref:TetR/AcrR family transcriptional regulator n=1 Tax=Trichlorobacter lovleyi TaxID=313985 RepID=UPI0023F4AD1A|nr:TetR/AcrR family transcriptional regulator [Trichlorobacter lovleyi]